MTLRSGWPVLLNYRGSGTGSEGTGEKGWRGSSLHKTLPRPLPLTLAPLLLILLLLALVPARDAAGAERTLSLTEAYRLALMNNENVRIADEGVSQAEATMDKAISTILPRFTAESRYTRYNEKKTSGSFVTQPDEAAGVDLRLTQPIYTGGIEWSARRQARLLIEKTSVGVNYVREAVILKTARAYFWVLKAGKGLEIKKAALKRADERKKVASARFRVGDVTRAAVLRAEAEAAGAEAALIRAESALRDSKAALKRVLGVAEELDGVEFIEPEISPQENRTLDDVIRNAYEKRLDYRQSVLGERIAEEGIVFARGNFLPSLKLEGLYSWKDQDPETTFFQKESASATLTLTYPIFEGGLRKAELDEARSRLREAELRKIGVKRDIEVEVREAFNNMESVKAEIESYRKQLSFAEEDYKMVFEQFKYGLSTTLDTIDADSTFISAQSSLSNALYDLQLSLIELKWRAGTLLEDSSLGLGQLREGR